MCYATCVKCFSEDARRNEGTQNKIYLTRSSAHQVQHISDTVSAAGEVDDRVVNASYDFVPASHFVKCDKN